jgi:hypothetical protein
MACMFAVTAKRILEMGECRMLVLNREFDVTRSDKGPAFVEAWLLDPQPDDGKITVVVQGKIRKLEPEDEVWYSYGYDR